MDKEIKDKWIEALRSGNYKQGKCGLRKDVFYNDAYEYCCLGVLCDTMPDVEWVNDDDSTWWAAKFKGGQQSAGLLPNDLGERVGLSRGDQDKLACLNDDDCLDFDEIADYINENL